MLVRVKGIDGNFSLIQTDHVVSVQQTVVENKPTTVIRMLNGSNFAVPDSFEVVEEFLTANKG